MLEEFPGLEEQIQLGDLFDENSQLREFFRQHFRAFLHYLEETEPSLGSHTGYMKKMQKHILKVVEVCQQECIFLTDLYTYAQMPYFARGLFESYFGHLT